MQSRRRYAVAPACLAVALVAGCGGSPDRTAAAAPAPSVSAPSSSSTSDSPTTPPPTTTTSAASTPRTATPSSATPTTRAASASAGALPPVPLAGAEPTVRFPRNEPAVGAGANATIGPVPDPVWARMVGYSWTQGCPVGRSQLRYVQVNFWGFDGARSRGAVVVNASIADAAAAGFTRLYDLRFRIRQMRPMDSSWGRNPKGPGADDYAAMRADNTSAFNCRYVGGQEASKVYSKHAYGTAIDVNDFENPYVDSDGTVYPGTYWLHRRGPAPGVFSSSGSDAVRAFTSQGLRWGGLWSQPDYQHFDR
ncbi:M15 family metallopeptidase [Pedococcus sp. NPDC057267]|uniref:M15 family metallopeptidase n=1 Tax=Pedococcus sp. NPDC057267 TaxID=3346077 RepID=UPI0036412BC5